jgi:hypothetical protein
MRRGPAPCCDDLGDYQPNQSESQTTEMRPNDAHPPRSPPVERTKTLLLPRLQHCHLVDRTAQWELCYSRSPPGKAVDMEKPP